jgi:hypothetical protein
MNYGKRKMPWKIQEHEARPTTKVWTPVSSEIGFESEKKAQRLLK